MENDQRNVEAITRTRIDNRGEPEKPEDKPEGNDFYLWLKETVNVKRMRREE